MSEKIDILPARPVIEPLESGCLRAWAPAKINLNLLVAPRRGDGFHSLDSFVARVTFYDRLDFTPREDGQIRISCTGFDCGADAQNLALRAAKALAEGRVVGGADVQLAKAIPPGRGLGGGSSDAASTLVALNGLWNLGLDAAALAAMAAQLGSDVPLFLSGPAARMTGRGELVEPVGVHPFVAVLLIPDFPCGTAGVYRAFDEHPGQAWTQLDPAVLTGPPRQWRGRLVNHLGSAAQRVCRPLKDLWAEFSAAIEELGIPVHLTGSGSTLFALCDDAGEAGEVLGALPDRLRRLCIAVTLSPI